MNDVKEGKVLQWVRPKEELDFDEKDCFKFHENYVPVVKSKKKRNKKEELWVAKRNLNNKFFNLIKLKQKYLVFC